MTKATCSTGCFRAPRLFLTVLVLSIAVIAGNGCVPFWVHHEAVKKNEDYLKIINGQQTEHKDLVRKSEEALSQAQKLQIERDRYKELYANADVTAKKLHDQLQNRLTTAVKTVDLGSEISGGAVTITEDNKISIAGDVLFQSGKASITQKAKDILAKLAPMLKNEFKDAYIRVEGHTDNQPISKPATLKNFPTNWHLSVARAVSVLRELKKLGVPEQKMYAAGYGEFNPRVPNSPRKKGAAGNRRVEIAIVSTK